MNLLKKYNMELSRHALENISPEKVTIPEEEVFLLPEKVLQFGSGILLRGLPDYFIDKANRQGVFNGRVVIVKTTSGGDINAFVRQNGLYTLCMRGIVKGEHVSENIILSSISRILAAQSDWKEILRCAHNADMKIVISNTTEVGIQLVKENIGLNPPESYPGKLLAFLYERFRAFNGSTESGLVIIPTELIPDNGKKLQAIILELAHFNNLENDFIEWLQKCNYFCSSLVDRIVTGIPSEETRAVLKKELGYTDDLLTVSEVYGLWAIEGNDFVKNTLSFNEVNDEVKVEPDINLHRELKLRLLNGTHTLSCGLAFLAGHKTVKDAMKDEMMSGFITDLMQNEISPSISYTIDESVKKIFIAKVLDRFRNPHINHFWKSIAVNYTSKIKIRCVPILVNLSRDNGGSVPRLIAFGFAAYLRFMKAVKQNGKDFFAECNSGFYLIEDEMAEYFYHLWKELPMEKLVNKVLADRAIWGDDLTLIPGFQDAVTENLKLIHTAGIYAALGNTYKKLLADE
jgi:tagaturonate reductase